MRWIVGSLMLGLSAAAAAQDGCGRGDASGGGATVTVIQTQWDATRRETWVHAVAPNADRSFELSVAYAPTGLELGPPVRLDVNLRVRLPASEEPQPEQLIWRFGSGEWTKPHDWATAQRLHDVSDMGLLYFQMAESRVFPRKIEWLAAIGQGARLEFKRLDRTGHELGSGSVDYPKPQQIADLFHAARAQAFSHLHPCGPPITIYPAPQPGR